MSAQREVAFLSIRVAQIDSTVEVEAVKAADTAAGSTEQHEGGVGRHVPVTTLELQPVVRIFGPTTGGQKACVHLRGAYPYFLLRTTGSRRARANRRAAFERIPPARRNAFLAPARLQHDTVAIDAGSCTPLSAPTRPLARCYA